MKTNEPHPIAGALRLRFQSHAAATYGPAPSSVNDFSKTKHLFSGPIGPAVHSAQAIGLGDLSPKTVLRPEGPQFVVSRMEIEKLINGPGIRSYDLFCERPALQASNAFCRASSQADGLGWVNCWPLRAGRMRLHDIPCEGQSETVHSVSRRGHRVRRRIQQTVVCSHRLTTGVAWVESNDGSGPRQNWRWTTMSQTMGE